MPPIDIDTQRQLLFDDALTQSRQGFEPVMNPAVRHDQPVLLPEKPWESLGLWRWVTVIHDDTEFRMWYEAYDRDPAGVFRHIPRLCYAVSHDGVTWEKPDLGAIEYQGSKHNNIVFEGLGNRKCFYPGKLNYVASGSVFKDPTAPPDRRYKYNFTDNHYPDLDAAQHSSHIYGACSPDGVHWKICKRHPIMPWYGDTMNVCFWDDRINKYVAYVRWDEGKCLRDGQWGYFLRNLKQELEAVQGWEDNPPRYRSDQHIRAIGRTEGEDFENLPEPQRILAADEQDDPNMGLYHTAAVKYPYAQNAYFFFPGAYYGEWRNPDTLEVQFAASRDGIHFQRFRRPFVRLGLEGAFDCRMIDMGVGMLRRGPELLMYYGGRNVVHAQEPSKLPGSGAIGMVRLRLDGFVSQDAPDSGGALTTAPLRFTGTRLFVNMDGSANGTLKVELLDEQGSPIPGFSGKDADLLYGNDINRPVTWKSSPDLSALTRQKRPYCLRFTGRAVKLYAFQFTCPEINNS